MAEELRTSSGSATTRLTRVRDFLRRYRWKLVGLAGVGLAVGLSLTMTGEKDRRPAPPVDNLAEFAPIQSVASSGAMPLISISSTTPKPPSETRTAELSAPASIESQATPLEGVPQPEPFSPIPSSLRGKEPVGAYFTGEIEPIPPQYPASPRR